MSGIVRPCKIEVADTSKNGAPRVPVGAVQSALANQIAEKFVHGKVSIDGQETINKLCASARQAGTLDTDAFEEALKTGKIDVKCEVCKYRRL